MTLALVEQAIIDFERKDILHSYHSDVTLIRSVATKQISIDQYKTQIIASHQKQVDELTQALQETEAIIKVIKHTGRQNNFKKNVTILQTKITKLEKEITELDKI